MREFLKDRPVFAWALYDWANSAFATTVMAGFFPVFFQKFWSTGVTSTETTSRLGYANAAAGFAIALLAPVLGAIGGGLAGHEIEKRARSTTAYQVKIRMADGSTRTVTQAQSLPVGQHVHVDGGKVTPVADEGNAATGGTRTLQTSART